MPDQPVRDPTAAIAAVNRRRAELGLSPPQLAKHAGVAPNTVRSFLRGETWPNMVNMGKMEKALGWAPGYIEDLALGITPTRGETQAGPVSPTGIMIVLSNGERYTVQLSGAVMSSLEEDSALERDEMLHSLAAEAARVAARHRRNS